MLEGTLALDGTVDTLTPGISFMGACGLLWHHFYRGFGLSIVTKMTWGLTRVLKLLLVVTNTGLLSQESSTCVQYLSLLLLLGVPQEVVAPDPPAAESLHLRNSAACC